ncbi:hypothetical protein [Pseudomonas fontis]|uniref:DUF4189 domain-containing protein n=1 Tax=Pseudomonas fontis TaxID=2942633 RepID=A0ABT5NYC9_9PSED|nr:hypothetical protein [Pseudomonas fontis]MDD0976790.1 hypothetical protein [Pseudomonas fontis]MDD0993211.1 hypothetical protein [Pseudomonas fontis]
MAANAAHRSLLLAIAALLVGALALLAGCSSHATAPVTGSRCYAKALPVSGEGGLAWGNTLQMARKKSMDGCMRYAGRSGGTPGSCKVVVAECK